MDVKVPSISVVLVSYNTKDLVLQNLDHLGNLPEFAGSEVILIDNASTDGTCDLVNTRFPGVKVIRSSENLGFGKANNRAMSIARGKYLLLLNTDAFPSAGMLATLTGKLEQDERLAVAAPQLLNKDRSLQNTVNSYPSWPLLWRNWLKPLRILYALIAPRSNEQAFDLKKQFLSGACLLVRRKAVEDTGAFDEEFFFLLRRS